MDDGTEKEAKMKRMAGILMGLLAVAFLIAGLSGEGLAKKEPPKSVTIENKNGNVTFPHEAHQKDIKCQTCHHMMDKDKEKVACRACHKPEAEGEMLGLKDAFHKTCRGCHDQKVKADPNSKAPTKCKDCHKK